MNLLKRWTLRLCHLVRSISILLGFNTEVSEVTSEALRRGCVWFIIWWLTHHASHTCTKTHTGVQGFTFRGLQRGRHSRSDSEFFSSSAGVVNSLCCVFVQVCFQLLDTAWCERTRQKSDFYESCGSGSAASPGSKQKNVLLYLETCSKVLRSAGKCVCLR